MGLKMNKPLEIKVKYSNVKGYHLFTSANPLTKGLCAGSDNLEVAFNEVATQINYLLEKNHSLRGNCESVMTFQEFDNWVTWILSNSTDHLENVPTAVIEYSRREAA